MNAERARQAVATLAVLIVIVAIVAGAGAANKKSKMAAITTTTAAPAPATTTTSTPSTSAAPAATSTYKDGTYRATGGFNTPGGPGSVVVSVTLKNDVITSTSTTSTSSDRESQRYDEQFIAVYQNYVQGRNISNLNLNRVAGASLTTIGFNNAIRQIEARA